MRNRKFIYAALALLTLGFTACQQEDDFAPQEQEIRVAFTTDAIQLTGKTATARCGHYRLKYHQCPGAHGAAIGA